MSLPDLRIEGTIRKHEDAKVKAKELEQSDGLTWKKVRTELDNFAYDIDEDLRQALAYFG
jgi:hypothetical protein